MIWISILRQYWYIAAIAILVASTAYYRADAQRQKEAFLLFESQVRVEGEAAKVKELEKEKARNEAIRNALAGRDDAIKRLRIAQAGSSSNVLPAAAAASASPDRICFTRAGLDDALKQFIGEAARIAEAGDSAIIDNRAWLNSWPR